MPSSGDAFPECLIPNPGTTLVGLAIPFNEGRDYLDYNLREFGSARCYYFNTLSALHRTFRARKLMFTFCKIYEGVFAPGGEFRFLEDLNTPQQGDGLSCGECN
jgi:hypothetical protein